MCCAQVQEGRQPRNDVVGEGRPSPLLDAAQLCLVDPHVQGQSFLAARALAAKALQRRRKLKNLLQAHGQHLELIESNIGFGQMLRTDALQFNR